MLTEQKKQFALEYLRLRCKNATQAAITAGYSKKTASAQASQILKTPEVQNFLEEEKRKIYQGIQQEFLFDALEAREALHGILNNPNASHRDIITVAKDFLDRAGFSHTQISVEVTGKEGGAVEINQTLNLQELTMEELEMLHDLSAKIENPIDTG